MTITTGAHNPSTQESAGHLCAFEAILVYIEKAIKGYPISKGGKKLKTTTKPHSSKNNVSINKLIN